MVGANPADWQVEIYDLVFAAQRAGREALAPDVEITVVDAAARDVGDRRRPGTASTSGTAWGTCVGLQIHEAPLIAGGHRRGHACCRDPVTVEPGVYLPGRGGVRIEDTLVVRRGRRRNC